MKKIIKLIKTVIKIIFGVLGTVIGIAAFLCAITLTVYYFYLLLRMFLNV